MIPPEARGVERWGSSLLALILAVACAFRLAQLDGLAPFIDESADLALSVDYQSWDVWSRLLHGKLLGYLWFKPIFLLAWDPLYAARLFSALTGIVSATLVYRLLLTQVSRKAALAGTAFLAFMPLVVFHDRLALFDGFVVASLTAGLLLYLRSRDDQSLLALLAAGFLFGIAVFTKAYALLAILVWLPVLRRRSPAHFRTVLIVGLGFLLCILMMGLFLAAQLSPNVHNLQAAFPVPHRFLAPELSVGERAGLALEQLGQIFGYFHGYNGWAFLPVVLLGALVPGGRRKVRFELLATWLLFCVVLSVAFRFLFSRYLLLSLPALALLVALTVDDCLEKITTIPRRVQAWAPFTFLMLAAICCAGFLYRDTRIAAQRLDRVLPTRDAYQYLWGAPSGFGLREVADQLQSLDLKDDRKVICVTRGMGTGTHGAATLPLLLRHTPIRFVHLWLKSDEDIQLVRDLPRRSRVVFFVDEPGFLNDEILSRLRAEQKVLFEVKGTTGRPDYRLFDLVRPLTNGNSSSRMNQ